MPDPPGQEDRQLCSLGPLPPRRAGGFSPMSHERAEGEGWAEEEAASWRTICLIWFFSIPRSYSSVGSQKIFSLTRLDLVFCGHR